jgi:hypothetical protein
MEHISAYTEEKSRQLSRTPRFVRWAVMLGIVIALNIFFLVIRQLAFPQPNYSDYCTTQTVPMTAPPAPQSQEQQQACEARYEKADTQYQLDSFILFIVLGVAAIIIGIMPLGSSIVSSGLSYGGVLSLVIGSAQYWGEAGSWLRLAISLIALIALLYVGFKKFRD